MPDLPSYTWSPNRRQFRDARGRFVSRAEVRGALDPFLDALAAEVREATEALVEDRISLDEWHGRLEGSIKEAHVAAGAIAAGGWQQATPDDWGVVGRRLKVQYQKLRQFARELEDGRKPLDGSTVARAMMYAIAPTGTYEAVLRRGDIAAGFRSERRILHSSRSCKPCLAYAARGWQPAGVLPNIGENCDCLSNCRCTFERKRQATRSRATTLTASFGELESPDGPAEFARGGGGKRAAKGKGGKAKGASGAKGSGNCGTGAGGFKAGNTCGGGGSAQRSAANRVKERLAAKSKLAKAEKAEKAAAGPAKAGPAGMVAKSRQASAAAAKVQAVREKAALDRRQAKNAKARERRAAKAEAAKTERASKRTPTINRMVAKSKDAASKGAASPSAKVRAEAKAAGYGPNEARQLGLAAGARAKAEAGKGAESKAKAVSGVKAAAAAARAAKGSRGDRLQKLQAKGSKISERRGKEYHALEAQRDALTAKIRATPDKNQKTFQKLMRQRDEIDQKMGEPSTSLARHYRRMDRINPAANAAADKAARANEARPASLKRLTDKSRVASGKAGAENAARKRAAEGKTTPENIQARLAAARAAQKADIERTRAQPRKAEAPFVRPPKPAPKPVERDKPGEADERWRRAGIQVHRVGGRINMPPVGGKATREERAQASAAKKEAAAQAQRDARRAESAARQQARDLGSSDPGTRQRAFDAKVAAGGPAAVVDAKRSAEINRERKARNAEIRAQVKAAAQREKQARAAASKPATVAARPISDPVRLQAESRKMDQAFDKAPGAKNNFVTLADLHKTMPHLSRQEFVAVVNKGRDDGKYGLDSHEGLANPATPEMKAAAIEEGGSRLIYISRRDVDDDGVPQTVVRSQRPRGDEGRYGVYGFGGRS